VARIIVSVSDSAVAGGSYPQARQLDIFYRPEVDEAALVHKGDRFFLGMQPRTGLCPEYLRPVLLKAFLGDSRHSTIIAERKRVEYIAKSDIIVYNCV
jgi:hypothetical protein